MAGPPFQSRPPPFDKGGCLLSDRARRFPPVSLFFFSSSPLVTRASGKGARSSHLFWWGWLFVRTLRDREKSVTAAFRRGGIDTGHGWGRSPLGDLSPFPLTPFLPEEVLQAERLQPLSAVFFSFIYRTPRQRAIQSICSMLVESLGTPFFARGNTLTVSARDPFFALGRSEFSSRVLCGLSPLRVSRLPSSVFCRPFQDLENVPE